MKIFHQRRRRGLSAMCCLIVMASIRPTQAGDRPNIIYLMADDQNTLSVGCYGNPEVQTPNIDRLARDGVVFDRHYNTTSICMASRASVFTGLYEYRTGTNFNHGDMRPDIWAGSYPVLLREAGYLTAFAGKFGMVVDGQGLCERDFDFWGGGPGQTSYETQLNVSMKKYAKEFPHATLSYAAFGRDVIRAAVDRNKPFCLSISFKAPHRPVGRIRNSIPFMRDGILPNLPILDVLPVNIWHRKANRADSFRAFMSGITTLITMA